MSNPDPVQSQGFKDQQFKSQDELKEPLAKTPINTKYEQSVYTVLRNLSDRQARIRRYVRAGLEADGLL